MKEFQADLHVHTCLSPCADDAMVPTAIVRRARAVDLNMIAICDHNSAENVAAVAEAGRRESLAVIPGVEVTSREEVHVLGLFDSEQGALAMQDVVYANLPGENDEEAFGPQRVVDAQDRVTGANRRLLIGATNLGLEQAVDAIHGCGGLAVAAHVDRQSFGLIGHLGFVPPGLKLDALEVSPRAAAAARHDLPLVTGSDAHGLERIGEARTSFWIEHPGAGELGKALRNEDGRRALIAMEDLSLHILDVAENALAAEATRITIAIAEDTVKDRLTLEIADNGRGMDAETRRRALDPFFTTRTTRRVGLGLPLLAQAARECDGTLELDSAPGRGTTVRAVFQRSHPDLKPFGDIVATIEALIRGRPQLDLQFQYERDSECVAQFNSGAQGTVPIFAARRPGRPPDRPHGRENGTVPFADTEEEESAHD